jgi:hypothetical protein
MNRGLVAVAFSCVLVAPSNPAWAQRSEPSAIAALEIDETVRVDGRLDEEVWSRAMHVSNFTQRELDIGSPATERTEVAILFDSDALYVGFWGFDSEPEKILANRMQRDFSWGSEDNFEVIFDTFNDDRNGYLFVTNPNGAKADALVKDNGSTMNRDWDGVWDVKTQRTSAGWFAEIRIPLTTLRFGPAPEEGWGVNFERNIRRKREQLLWQGWSRDFNLERLSQAGSLTGLSGITSVNLAEFRPHAVGGREWLHETDSSRSVGDVGLDVNYLISSNLKLNVAVNPDFAQVESDREEVNLTRFSLFYPEKRHFFLEGQEFFDFTIGSDTRPFYSRRIGLAPDRTEIPILGGARMLGKFEGTTLGAMVLRTLERDENPGATFGVARLKRDVLDESSIGILAVGRQEQGRSNATYGFDFLYATSSVFGDKELEAGLALAQTYTSDASDRFGLAHRVFLSYPNDLVEFTASWTRAGSDFNPEVGFIRRGGYQRFASELALSPRPAFLPFVRQLEIKPFEASYYIDDETHELESFYAEFVPLAVTFRSGDGFEFNIQRRAENLDEPFEILEGEEIPEGEYWYTRWAADFETFSGRVVSGDIELSGGDFYLGQRTFFGTGVSWKVNRYLSVRGDYEWNRISFSGEQFTVEEVGGRFDFATSPVLFGALAWQWNSEDREVILNFRINWIPKPGTDLFLVINQIAETDESRWTALPTSRWTAVRTTALSKLVWRFEF